MLDDRLRERSLESRASIKQQVVETIVMLVKFEPGTRRVMVFIQITHEVRAT